MLAWYGSAMREAKPLSGQGDSGAVSLACADRRPIRLRDARWAQVTASFLARFGVRPNQISCASMLASGAGAVSLYFFPQPWKAIICVLGVQLRLLCNLLDGMVAVEHLQQTPLGVLYNELPDRVSDSVLFIALGFAQDFRGPMAKQHRMAVLTAGCLVSIIEHFTIRTNHTLPITCGVIAAGSLL